MAKNLPAMKDTTCIAGDAVSIPESRRFPGEGSGNSLQYSWLENPRDRGTWWAMIHEVAKESDMT